MKCDCPAAGLPLFFCERCRAVGLDPYKPRTTPPTTAENWHTEWYFCAAARENQDWSAAGGTWITFPYRWFRKLCTTR